MYRRCLSEPAGRPVRAAGLTGDDVVRRSCRECAAPAHQVVAAEVELRLPFWPPKKLAWLKMLKKSMLNLRRYRSLKIQFFASWTSDVPIVRAKAVPARGIRRSCRACSPMKVNAAGFRICLPLSPELQPTPGTMLGRLLLLIAVAR